MKTSFNIWRTNLMIALALAGLALAEAALIVYLGWSSWSRALLLMAQANIELYTIYFVSTQSDLSFLRVKSLTSVLLRQTAFSVVYAFLLVWTWHWFYPNTVSIEIPSKLFFTLLICGWVLITLLGIIHYLVWHLVEQEQRILLESGVQDLKNEAELFKLRQQLHPHFLFNSLNSINALIGSDPKQARVMLMKLSSFLRQTIRKEDSKSVSLSAELEELDLYLEIEKVRFGDRLVVLKDLPTQLDDKMIPPFLLQPLVENAIKFGLYDTLNEVNIGIMIREEPHFYKFEISNPFDRNSVAPRGTGFGLEGISRRLYLLYARNDLLQIEKSQGLREGDADIYIARLLIPKD